MRSAWTAALLAIAAACSRGQTGPQGPPGSAGSQGPAGASLNPLQIALLRWYPANQTATFPAGQWPNAIAFDGVNLWITNNVAAGMDLGEVKVEWVGGHAISFPARKRACSA